MVKASSICRPGPGRRRSTLPTTASTTRSASTGTGTLTPSALRIARALRSRTLEDDLVDLVVGAVEEDGLDLVARLAEAVDAALALLEAVRVPGQVVVDDRVEVLLEVDALGQAVGRDQDAPVVADQLLDPLAPSSSPTSPVTARTSRPRTTCRGASGATREVLGRRDEPAEHDRLEAVLEQLTEGAGERLQLAVLAGPFERPGAPAEPGKAPALGVGPGASASSNGPVGT